MKIWPANKKRLIHYDESPDELEIQGNIDVNGTANVSGASTLTGNVSCGGTLAVTGATTLSSTLKFTGIAAIADPGASGAIPVTGTGYVPLVTAGAETRTLAAPGVIGAFLLLYMKTDGGNCVVTCATTFNETGNNTLTFANTGEACLLVSVEEGSNKRWRSVFVDGCALTTV